MIAEEIKIECEENGFHLCVDGETWLIADPEALYDHVKATIGPWLYERDMAKATFRCNPDESAGMREAYEISNPKHPDHHDTMSAIADQRDAFTIWRDEDR